MQAFLLIWFLLGPVIQTAVLVLMVRHRLFRRGMFPFFFTYTLYSVLVTILRILLLNRTNLYPIFYWSTEVIYGLLALLSLNEVFKRVFRLDYEEHPRLRLVFPLVVLAICIGLFVWWRFVYRTRNGSHFGLLASAFVGFNEGVHSIEGILMVIFMLLWLFLAPGWNRYDYGVLLGFGLSGLITMTADMVRFNVGHGYQLWYKYAPATTYAIVTMIWLHAFWPAPDPRPQSLMRFQVMIEQAKRDNELIKLVHEWLNRQRRNR